MPARDGHTDPAAQVRPGAVRRQTTWPRPGRGSHGARHRSRAPHRGHTKSLSPRAGSAREAQCPLHANTGGRVARASEASRALPAGDPATRARERPRPAVACGLLRVQHGHASAWQASVYSAPGTRPVRTTSRRRAGALSGFRFRVVIGAHVPRPSSADLDQHSPPLRARRSSERLARRRLQVLVQPSTPRDVPPRCCPFARNQASPSSSVRRPPKRGAGARGVGSPGRQQPRRVGGRLAFLLAGAPDPERFRMRNLVSCSWLRSSLFTRDGRRHMVHASLVESPSPASARSTHREARRSPISASAGGVRLASLALSLHALGVGWRLRDARWMLALDDSDRRAKRS